MNFQVAGFQTEGYRVNTPVFEGPLDLLLDLIEKAELDITRLALAQVTDQYLEYLLEIDERSAAEVSAFLVIAARLLQIKSSVLLPRPPVTAIGSEDIDDGEALVRQLVQYKRFKEIALLLGYREQAGLKTYLRVAPPVINVESKLDLSDVSVNDLLKAAKKIFLKNNLPELDQVVTMPRVTIRQKIRTILDVLKTQSGTSFQTLLETHNRAEIVVTFLAMLELIKRHIIEVQQLALFDDIQMSSLQEIEDDEELEVEFDE